MSTPRILIISDEGPQTGTAGGLLLHRLLIDYPVDRLRVIARYVPTLGEPLPHVVYHPLTPPWQRFEKSRFNRLKRSLRAFGCVPTVSLARLDALVGDFQPEVVLCVMQHAAYYDTAARYARTRNLPLIVIVHDVNDDFEPVLPWAQATACRRDAAVYRQAGRRLCISPEMEAYCHERYGVTGDVLYPNRSPELDPLSLEKTETLRTTGQLTLGFAGNLGYGYGRELVRRIPNLRSTGSRLIIYSKPPGSDCRELGQATDCVELRGFRPAKEAWANIQRDCDAVWLPYPVLAAEFERLYRHHFPSKLTEYLALGLPVLVTGPSFATGVRWVLRHPEAAAVALDPTDQDITSILLRLRDDSALRANLARRALIDGDHDFSPARLVASFYQHLGETVHDFKAST
jgi:glycosyltransferase involved in cell wall biosynthesis